MKQTLIIAISLFLIACGSTQQTTLQSNGSSSANQDAVLWQQTSAEYTALCYQAYNTASQNIKKLSRRDDFEPGMIIVMDLDETVLDNSPYNAWLVKNGKSYSENTWNKWVSEINAKAVPGSVEFIRLANKLKFDILFISNRSSEFGELTLENMQKLGIEADQRQLLLKESESSKENRRAKAKSMNKIAMLIGDNLADFHDVFDQEFSDIENRKMPLEKFSENFGRNFIILPNPMYGNWKKVLPNQPLDALETSKQ